MLGLGHGSLVSPTGLYVPLHCVSLLLFVTETGNRMRVLVGLDFVNSIKKFKLPCVASVMIRAGFHINSPIVQLTLQLCCSVLTDLQRKECSFAVLQQSLELDLNLV